MLRIEVIYFYSNDTGCISALNDGWFPLERKRQRSHNVGGNDKETANFYNQNVVHNQLWEKYLFLVIKLF